MKLRVWQAAFVATAFIVTALPGHAAEASEQSVAEKILDILREQGQISEQQYDDLKEQARAETVRLETPPVSAGDEGWKTYWKDGVRVDSPDGKIKMRFGGRLMMDFAKFDADNDVADFFGESDLDNGSGTEIRRARLFWSGTLWERTKFEWQFDFADGDVDLKDGFLEFVKIPLAQNIKIGHYKEPFSLEELTSSKYITFMERSLTNAFAPSRNTGIGVQGTSLDKRMTWAAGFFRQTDDNGFSFTNDEINNSTFRVTGLPWYEEEGRKLLHLGVSYSHTHSQGNLQFRSRPEAHLSPVRYVDTGSFDANRADLINPEIALVYGPFSLQGEYTYNWVDSPVGNNPDFSGFYLETSYFLTGEHRNYKTSSGAFGRVRPKKNFDLEGGYGAWELAARFSKIDLRDANIDGGELEDWTVGLNWYVNPNVRLMFNYVYADLQHVGDSNIFEGRMQFDF